MAGGLCLANVAEAQVSVRLGATRSEAGTFRANGPQISPRLDWTRGQVRGYAEVGFTSFEGVTAWQLAAHEGQSWTRGQWSWGSDVSVSANLLSGGTASGRGTLGGGVGRNLGWVVLGVGSGIGGMRSTAGTFRALLDYRLTMTMGGNQVGIVLKGQGTRVLGEPLGYHDVEYGLFVRERLFSVATVRTRRWFLGRHGRESYQVRGALTPLQWLSFDLGGGRAPASLEGYSEGTYLTAGVRLTFAKRARGPLIERTTTGARVAFRVSGREVAIAGEWNNWTPIPMTRDAAGRWSAELALPPGAHKFMLIIDGKNVVPAGTPKLPDGFGGEVGLLVL